LASPTTGVSHPNRTAVLNEAAIFSGRIGYLTEARPSAAQKGEDFRELDMHQH
jgi:hypothetical protein